MPIWRASYTIEDEQGKKRVMTLHMNNEFSTEDSNFFETELVLFAKQYAEFLDTLITGVITDINLTQSINVSEIDIKRIALASSDVEEGALFVCDSRGEFLRDWITTKESFKP